MLPKRVNRADISSWSSRLSAMVRSGGARRGAACTINARPRSECLQVFDQIRLLCRREIEAEQRVVVIDHRVQVWRAPVMEVRRVLQEASKRRRPVLARRRPGGV